MHNTVIESHKEELELLKEQSSHMLSSIDETIEFVTNKGVYEILAELESLQQGTSKLVKQLKEIIGKAEEQEMAVMNV